MKTNLLKIFVLIFFLSFATYSQNLIDSACKKQGPWVILGKDKVGTSCYKPFQKVEEGEYLNNRKTGVWKEYYCSGSIKNIITFNDGRPNGPAKMYHENGELNEEGSWSKNRWIGDYKKYDLEGRLIHTFFFDENGKRVMDSTHIYRRTDIYDIPDGKKPIKTPN